MVAVGSVRLLLREPAVIRRHDVEGERRHLGGAEQQGVGVCARYLGDAGACAEVFGE